MSVQFNSFQQNIPKQTWVVFLDFDNTITSLDVLDGIMKQFAIGQKWKTLQKKWENGEINTLDCLKGQLDEISFTKEKLALYLSQIKIDPGFRKLLSFLKKRDIPVIIVSDNFDIIIKQILKNNRLHKRIKIYSNKYLNLKLIKISSLNFLENF